MPSRKYTRGELERMSVEELQRIDSDIPNDFDSDDCGTLPPTEQKKAKLKRQRKHVRDNISSILPKLSFQDGGEIPEILKVPVVFWNVHQSTEYDSDGKAMGEPLYSYCDYIDGLGISNYESTTGNDLTICKDRIDKDIRYLNIAYAPAGIEFELLSGYEQIQEASDYGYNCICDWHCSANWGETFIEQGICEDGDLLPGCCENSQTTVLLQNYYNIDGAVNIYFYKEHENTSRGGTRISNALHVRHGRSAGGGNPNSTTWQIRDTLVHEMGHLFSISHVTSWYKDNHSRELVDGSDCEERGDFICDTQPEPALYTNVDGAAGDAWHQWIEYTDVGMSYECIYHGYGGSYDTEDGMLTIGGWNYTYETSSYPEYNYCEAWNFEDPYDTPENCELFTNYDQNGDFFGTWDLPDECYEEVGDQQSVGAKCHISNFNYLPNNQNIMHSGFGRGPQCGFSMDPNSDWYKDDQSFTNEQYANMRYSAINDYDFIPIYNDFNTVTGCTDPNACNYTPDLDGDDGSCDYCSCTDYPIQEFECIISFGENAGDPQVGDVSCEGALEGDFCGSYDPNSPLEVGSCQVVCFSESGEEEEPEEPEEEPEDGELLGTVRLLIGGSNSIQSCNKNENSNNPDGCQCSTENGDIFANFTGVMACEYYFAECVGGNCIAEPNESCSYSNWQAYFCFFLSAEEEEIVDIYGCTDSGACNYNSDATDDDGSCDYGTTCWDGTIECNSDDCPEEPVVITGCTDSGACNYNSDATNDDGSCDYGTMCWDGSYECEASDCPEEPVEGELLGTVRVGWYTTNYYDDTKIQRCNYDAMGDNNHCQCHSEENIPGSDGVTACEYFFPECSGGNCIAETNESCTYGTDGYTAYYCTFVVEVEYVYGCTDANASNYNGDATDDDGSCEYEVTGCTDANASNYNGDATDDDGSCEYEVTGCTDESACNHNSEATDDDGSCTYPQENYDCDGNCIAEGGNLNPETGEDCNGDCNGEAIQYECGCGSYEEYGTYENYSGVIDACDCAGNILDCANECNGNAEYDDCNICNGDGPQLCDKCSNNPSWVFTNVDVGYYEFTSTITGLVLDVDGEQLGGNGSILAAFASDGSIRGIATQLIPDFGSYSNSVLYELQLYSNESSGEILTFKFYNAQTGEVLDTLNSFEFINLNIVGDVLDPYVFEVTRQVHSTYLEFYGDNDHVDFGNIVELQSSNGTPLNELSIALWFKFNDVNIPQAIITKGGYYNNASSWSVTWDSINKRMQFSLGQDYFMFQEGGLFDNISNNTWHHLVLTYSNIQNFSSFYLDGAPLSGSSYSGSYNAEVPISNESVKIGTDKFGDQALQGAIREVGIWTGFLSGDAVNSIYNSGDTINLLYDSDYYLISNTLEAYWKLDEGSGSSITDYSGNNNNGSMENMSDDSWNVSYQNQSTQNEIFYCPNDFCGDDYICYSDCPVDDDCYVCDGDGTSNQGCGCFEEPAVNCGCSVTGVIGDNVFQCLNLGDCPPDDDDDGICDTVDECVGTYYDCTDFQCGESACNVDNCYNYEDFSECDCDGTLPTGCDNECGSIAELDECSNCGGNGVLDDCGVCDGANYFYTEPSGAGESCGFGGGNGCYNINGDYCDCNEKINDCQNICGGQSELDDCGVCDGFGAIYGLPSGGCCEFDGSIDANVCCNTSDLECGCGQPAPSGCDNQCGSTAELDECGVCNGDGSSCNQCGEPDFPGLPCGVPEEFGGDGCTPYTYDVGDIQCCNDELPDCAGNCNGDLELDECGICGGNNSSCSDCAGVPNGNNWVSDCGCVTTDNSGDDCDDCAGTPNGSAELDECGVCNGTNISCTDCAGEINGSAVIDDCDVCGGNNADKDECGICFGDNSTCAGCDGEPNSGLVIDECGVCGGDGLNEVTGCCGDLVKDCTGECGGTAEIRTYYNSADNDPINCNTPTESGIGCDQCDREWCDASVPYGWFLESTSDCDGCLDGEIDCNGICNGNYSYCDDSEACNYDECGEGVVCIYSDELTKCCEDGLGSNGEEQDCTGICGGTNICGCTDLDACNYDASVTVDVGTCWYNMSPCTCNDGEDAIVDCEGDCNGGNECIPFGSQFSDDGIPLNWNDDDIYAYITNPNVEYSSLLIDLESEEIERNVFLDRSGNDFVGMGISDYKVRFDNQTVEPIKNKFINRINLGKDKNGAF